MIASVEKACGDSGPVSFNAANCGVSYRESHVKLRYSLFAAAITAGVSMAVSTAPAEAQWRRGGYGPGIALGLGAGILGGAIIASQRPYYYGGGGYYAPAYAAPVYGAPVYGAPCWRERRPVHDSWGNFRGYRVIRVCN